MSKDIQEEREVIARLLGCYFWPLLYEMNVSDDSDEKKGKPFNGSVFR